MESARDIAVARMKEAANIWTIPKINARSMRLRAFCGPLTHLPIDIIGYIMAQILPTCRARHERQAAISINTAHPIFRRSGVDHAGEVAMQTDLLRTVLVL